MRDLTELRQQIDEIDQSLVRLFEQRMAVVQEVGIYKKEHQLPILDTGREQDVLQSRAALLQNRILQEPLQAWFRTLMTVSKELEEPCTPEKQQPGGCALGTNTLVTVAYYGIPGAYCHDALQRVFPTAEELSCSEFEQVFQAVAAGTAAYGILPAENTTTGTIADVYDLMMAYKVSITGELVVPIHHCLLGVQGAELSDICQIYSHKQGIEQCHPFLAAHPQWETSVYGSTALSARYVQECGDPHKAAIASQHAAQTYGLQVLAANIQKEAGNCTRFFVIAASDNTLPQTGGKLSLTFTLQHRAGALYEVLGVFAGLHWNLSRIESRPILGQNFCYRFFVEMEGDFSLADATMLSETLTSYTESCRLLGLYPKVVTADG